MASCKSHRLENESGGQWLGMTSAKSHRCWGVGCELKAGYWGKNSGCSSI